MSERGQLRISSRTWHGRVYLYWRARTKKRLGDQYVQTYQNIYGVNPRPRENLCHYVRVVLFWAPGRWFITHRIRGSGVRPWMPVTALLTVTCLVICLMRWPTGTVEVIFQVLAMWGVVSLITACVIFVFWFSEVIRDHLDQRSISERDETFLSAVGRWVTAKKHRVCPFIEVEEPRDG